MVSVSKNRVPVAVVSKAMHAVNESDHDCHSDED